MGLCHVVRREAECWEIFEIFLGAWLVTSLGINECDVWAATGDRHSLTCSLSFGWLNNGFSKLLSMATLGIIEEKHADVKGDLCPWREHDEKRAVRDVSARGTLDRLELSPWGDRDSDWSQPFLMNTKHLALSPQPSCSSWNWSFYYTVAVLMFSCFLWSVSLESV